MTAIIDQATAQLRRELGVAASAWMPVVGVDLGVELERTVADAAPRLAQQLASDDDHLAAETVIDVLNVLWPHGDPEDHQPDWWRTPVGRLCARSLGRDDTDAVTHSVAAAMLGVARGTVGTLVTRGALERHPDGGITRASVLARIHRLGEG